MSNPKGTAEEAARWMDLILRSAEGVSLFGSDDLYDLYDFLERARGSLPTDDAVARGTRALRHDLSLGVDALPPEETT